MNDSKEEPGCITQVRRVSRPSFWVSRTRGEIELPPPGPGPAGEALARLRAAFAEGRETRRRVRQRSQ